MNRIRISGDHYKQLREHLFPGDFKEAVAVALCGRSSWKENTTLLVQEVFLIHYDKCYERRGDYVHWPTDIIIHLIEKAKKKGLAILKIHCHPRGGEFFSAIDTESDINLFTGIHSWLDDGLPHASCIMLPDGRIFGRFINEQIEFEEVDQILISGSTIYNWQYNNKDFIDESIQLRNLQTFGRKTISMLSNMKAGVIGCSGTGSPLIEQLKRLGVGSLVLVDPDYVDKLNLNRIINSTLLDAENKVAKVNVMQRSIKEAGFCTETIVFDKYVTSFEVIKQLAECDVLFCCPDSAEARHVSNLISSFYLLPLFDLGVKLDADGKGGIENIFGSVHYIQPGGSSLLSRKQYSLQALETEGIKRTNPKEYEERCRNGYLKEVNESSPAVISINMQVAATAVNDFLNRIHPFRNITNEEVSLIRILFNELSIFREYDETPCSFFNKYTGKGDIEPLLNLSEIKND
ncbi:ThiF family adenylyltransferase [Parafilimonas sp.]|uniref:ThiF family adenylyltransferase n=1 Tax=Parafilimonas sp. TaxID=1969739 RepID=UPI003F809E8B